MWNVVSLIKVDGEQCGFISSISLGRLMVYIHCVFSVMTLFNVANGFMGLIVGFGVLFLFFVFWVKVIYVGDL